jgi:uncharacterized protein (TIGR02679 family)
MTPRPDLLTVLDRPTLAGLWRRVREKLEERGGVGGTISLAGLGEEERDAVAELLGSAMRPRPEARIRLDRIDRALRGSRFAVDLVAAMERLGGPLRNRPAERSADEAAWEELWRRGLERLVRRSGWEEEGRRAALETWLGDLRAGGLLRRLAGAGGATEAGRLLDGVAAVLGALASAGTEGGETVRRRVLAADRLGSSHALDDGTPVASLVLRALAALAGEAPPGSAGERRALWEWAGVVPDDLSCDVLVHGLAPLGDGLVAEHLRAFAAAGEPVRLTLRQLAGGTLRLPAGTVVSGCENPALVAVAADRLGGDCRPLVCLAGMASSAALRLLSLLAGGGAHLRYHGDFDWGGLRIANALRRTVTFEPWRYTAADYRAAVAENDALPPLQGTPVPASWDPELARVMERTGLALEEEAVIDRLLEDLAL